MPHPKMTVRNGSGARQVLLKLIDVSAGEPPSVPRTQRHTWPLLTDRIRRDQPHGRGEHRCAPGARATCSGPSPRARGALNGGVNGGQVRAGVAADTGVDADGGADVQAVVAEGDIPIAAEAGSAGLSGSEAALAGLPLP